MCEAFSEMFAVAALLDSPYSEFDYYNMLSYDDKQELVDFFQVLISTQSYNAKGNRSWEQLKKKYSQDNC
jgi:hypothetical protein